MKEEEGREIEKKKKNKPFEREEKKVFCVCVKKLNCFKILN